MLGDGACVSVLSCSLVGGCDMFPDVSGVFVELLSFNVREVCCAVVVCRGGLSMICFLHDSTCLWFDLCPLHWLSCSQVIGLFWHFNQPVSA